MGSHLVQPIAIRAAYLLKPGKDHPDQKWWFDMEYIDDVINSREQANNIDKISD